MQAECRAELAPAMPRRSLHSPDRAIFGHVRYSYKHTHTISATGADYIVKMRGHPRQYTAFHAIGPTDGAAREEPSSLVLFRVATEVERSSREAAVFFIPIRQQIIKS